MGVSINNIHSYFEKPGTVVPDVQPLQVLGLAKRVLQPLVASGIPENISHVIFTTSCPDSIAPSLGQQVIEEFHESFSRCHAIDIVQGCAGGVSAMILASQLCEMNKSSVLVVQADAAKKAASKTKKIHQIFGNGSFACICRYDSSTKGLLHSQSKHYKGLYEVVSIKLGHDADRIIMKEKKDMAADPRIHLGLSVNNAHALKLFSKAEKFYLDFVRGSSAPEVMILHQVNPLIVKHLKAVFKKYPLQFIDVASQTGNCGVASVGIALSSVMESIQDKKVLLCSFGTGGVITAGMWQL